MYDVNNNGEISRRELSIYVISSLGIKCKTTNLTSAHEVMCCCPRHKDSVPSMGINLDTGVYHCFSCNSGGSVESLYQDLTGNNLYRTLGIKNDPFSNFARQPIYRYNYEDEDTALKNVHVNYDKSAFVDPWTHADCSDYIRGRGITKEVADYFGFRYCEDTRINMTRFHQRLIIPVYEDGQLISIEGRRIYPTEEVKVLYPRNCTVNTLMDIDNLNRKDDLFGVEGMMDLCVLRTCPSFKNSTSIFGAGITKRQLSLIKEFKRFIYIADADQAGDKTLDTLKNSGLSNVYQLKLPKSVNGVSIKDVGDLPKAGATPQNLIDHKWLSYIRKL